MLNGFELAQGDAMAIHDDVTLEILSQADAEVLLFDLPEDPITECLIRILNLNRVSMIAVG